MKRSEAEAGARRLMRRALPREFRLAGRCEDLLRRIAAELDGLEHPRPHQTVARILLARVADDLRASLLCAANGYIPQMMTLGASIHELAHTAAFIGGSDERATTWLEWETLERTPWRRQEVVTGALKNAERPPSSTQDDLFYMALCWAKHGNPRLQSKLEAAVSPAGHLLEVDPLVNPGTLKRAQVAFFITLRPVVIGLLAFNRQGLLPDQRLAQVGEIVLEWNELKRRLPKHRE